jgi:glucose/mannose transport system permease protein
MATTPLRERVHEAVPRRRSQWAGLAVLIVAFLFYMLPIYVMLVSGRKRAQDVSLARMWALPVTWSAGGFEEAWGRLSPNMMNSIKMVVPATVLASVIGAVNCYLFSKWRFRGSEVLFTLLESHPTPQSSG